MASRPELQTLFETVLGSKNVYFQPPASVNMKYPAIVYSLDSIDSGHADDGVYFFNKRYSVTVIYRDPDSDLVDKLAQLPTCRHNRHYTKDNLNHDVFLLFH